MTSQGNFEEDFKPPLMATIEGVEVVTIPLADYKALLSARRIASEHALDKMQLSVPRRGVIERNPEVAVFLAQRFGLKPVKVILRECKRRFGSARTPSKSVAYRYWLSLRKGGEKSSETGD